MLIGILRHGFHHGLWPAGLNHVETLTLKNGMIGNEASLTSRAILGGDMHWSCFLEIVKFEQVFRRTRAKQELWLTPILLQTDALPKQWGNTHAATNKEYLWRLDVGALRFVRGETVPKWKNAVEGVAGIQIIKVPRAISNGGNKQPQLVALAIYKIDGDGAAQECGR